MYSNLRNREKTMMKKIACMMIVAVCCNMMHGMDDKKVTGQLNSPILATFKAMGPGGQHAFLMSLQNGVEHGNKKTVEGLLDYVAPRPKDAENDDEKSGSDKR